jgi:Acetyltransferase (GNAT) family
MENDRGDSAMFSHKPNRASMTSARENERDFSIRRFRSADQADVFHLYTHGLLGGHLNPNDQTSDLDDIERSYFQRAQDNFWVAEAKGELIGMVAISEGDKGVMDLRRLRVAPLWQLESRVAIELIRTAIIHARLRGCLKFVFHTSLDAPKALDLLNGLGLQLSRIRHSEGQHLIEVYDDVYAGPSGHDWHQTHLHPPAAS